jgi:hypothetical protein
MAESSFPQGLDFSPQPLAISARSYMAKCVPESSSTGNPNDIVRIRIPSGRAGSYLNNSKSFLSFEVLNTSTCPIITESVGSATPPVGVLRDSKLHIDGSAYAVIQTQEVYNSSNLLESIQNANVLYNMLVDLQTSMGSRLTGSKILGIGATNVNQAWNTYHGQTLSLKADNEGIYTTFNRVYPDASNNLNIANTIYAGLNILGQAPDLQDPAQLSRVIAQTVVQGTGAGQPVLVQEDGSGIRAFPGPININFPFARVGCADGSPQRAGQAAALDQGANGVSSFISRLGPVVPFGQKQRFCLPLVSGVVGSLCCKLFPLHALNSDLMLHFTLASNNTVACNDYIPTSVDTSKNEPQGVAVGGLTGNPILFTPSYRLEQIAYHACIVEVSAQAQAMLDQATGGQYVIPSASYRNFTHTLQPGTSVNEFPVPARFTSVKSIVACQRPSASLERADRFSLTSRIKNNMTAIQYRVGSLLVPQEPIKMGNIDPSLIHPRSGTAPEAFAHLLEAIGQCVSDRTLECGMDDAIYGANHDGADYDYGDTPGSGVTTPYDWVQQVNVGGATASYNAAAAGAAATLAANGQSDRRFYQRMSVGSTAGFCWGLDMESFNSAMCHGPLQSGTNTLGLNIMCRLYADTLQTETGGTVDVAKHMVATQVDHWVCFDQVLVISGGVCSTRF